MSLATRITAAFQAVAADIKALGTAAYATITTSAYDTTIGRLLKVGDFGQGSLALSAGALTNINNLDLATGDHGYGANTTGAPTTSPGVLTVARYSAAASRQTARPVNGASDVTTVYERQVRTGPVYGAWVPVYTAGNLLGAVSQTAGVPTGAVIERGSNANGSYVRFADGTQIAWSPTFSTAATTATGSVFSNQGDVKSWTYPAAFSVAPEVISTPGTNSTSWGCANAAAGLTSANLRIFSSGSIASGSVSGVAIGRWY